MCQRQDECAACWLFPTPLSTSDPEASEDKPQVPLLSIPAKLKPPTILFQSDFYFLLSHELISNGLMLLKESKAELTQKLKLKITELQCPSITANQGLVAFTGAIKGQAPAWALSLH